MICGEILGGGRVEDPFYLSPEKRELEVPFNGNKLHGVLLIHLGLQFGCFKESYLLTQVQPFGPHFSSFEELSIRLEFGSGN